MTRPGHDGMPPQGQDFAEYVRHALHAAADQVEPRPDGLERIRARVGSAGAFGAVGAVGAGPAYVSEHPGATPATARAGFLAERIRRWKAMRGWPQAATKAEPGHARRQPGDWRDSLLRPVLAIACAVFAVGVVLAFPPTREAMLQIGSAVGITTSSSASGNG
ncbi:MAG: hypothetical protein ACRDOH_12220, partial [Streptosporangiaceae bacterium]